MHKLALPVLVEVRVSARVAVTLYSSLGTLIVWMSPALCTLGDKGQYGLWSPMSSPGILS